MCEWFQIQCLLEHGEETNVFCLQLLASTWNQSLSSEMISKRMVESMERVTLFLQFGKLK